MNKFSAVACLAFAGVLAGCASGDDLRKKEPVFFATTDKSPQDYAACVARGWRAEGRGEVVEQPIRNGVDVISRGRFNVEEIVRIQHYEGKTHINMYARTKYNYQALMQSVNLCQ